MIAVDTQILVYAHRGESIWHARAKARLAELAISGARWGIPMHCLVEFYAIVTNVYRPPTSIDGAVDQIDAWLDSPTVEVLTEDGATWSIVRDQLIGSKIVGPAAYDARIAAVCIQHGVSELWTNDRDYLRFPSLRITNPLVEPTGAAEPRARYKLAGRRASGRTGG